MNILIDENIAFAREAFSEFGNVQLVHGRKINKNNLKEVDTLIVRSVTKVDESLLRGTNIRFVGTATIATDHIDLEYLKEEGIEFSNAAGSNADSVTEYFITALLSLAVKKRISLSEKTIGIVGIGNIGSRVSRIANALGLNVLKNDPPLERQGIGSNYCSIDEVLNADIITLHVPLTRGGTDKTFHLLDYDKLSRINDEAIIINTARGSVIDNNSLFNVTASKKFNLILDVWEGEPFINTELLNVVTVGTPHIAGYSLEGKVNGTTMIYDALCRYLGKIPTWKPELPEVQSAKIKLPDGNTFEERLYKLLTSVYNIVSDDERMRKMIKMNRNEARSYFDLMRKVYPMRREYSNFSVTLKENEGQFKPILEALRMRVNIE